MQEENNKIETIDACKPDFTTEYLLSEFKYQHDLTLLLDKNDKDFNQETINQIVLWKVNRYAEVPANTLAKINKINKNTEILNEDLTREIIAELLNPKVKGFGLPMVSTILRFRNPNIYQIIDQRVYRFIYGKDLILKNTSTEQEINSQITLYLDYLKYLRQKCDEIGLDFKDSDRILYIADKKINKQLPLKRYGNKQ